MSKAFYDIIIENRRWLMLSRLQCILMSAMPIQMGSIILNPHIINKKYFSKKIDPSPYFGCINLHVVSPYFQAEECNNNIQKTAQTLQVPNCIYLSTQICSYNWKVNCAKQTKTLSVG